MTELMQFQSIYTLNHVYTEVYFTNLFHSQLPLQCYYLASGSTFYAVMDTHSSPIFRGFLPALLSIPID